MLLGCIADDLTGATDLALMLTRGGMRTVQLIGVPAVSTDIDDMDAAVVALKSRTSPVQEAVTSSLRSADVLLARGAKQLFFKYCSTFDSTDKGNIGPVAEALLTRVKGDIALVCPAFPTNKRTVYLGHLFVGDVPLHESPMKDHPLTPMCDSNLVRVLRRQTKLGVGLIPYSVVDCGAAAIKDAFGAAAKDGARFVVVDAICDRHLLDIGTAAESHALVTGGSGVAMGLPANFVRQGLKKKSAPIGHFAAAQGRSAIIAGSCSEATRGQVRAAQAAGLPTFKVDPRDIARGALSSGHIASWALKQPADQPVVIYSSAEPADVRAAQAELGQDKAGALVEHELAAAARLLADCGVTRLIVAGGETSGAVVGALGVKAVDIGPEIDPGVPWTRSRDNRGLLLALKSGNFGAPDFFLKAWDLLE
ncbi:MAG TPA: 3-oxo-tetronate kinase [Hyphomicrobiaceae bacterium]|nr:3-oxo-tetronate kinase [Hyphomicrobiaceae bacterium]